MKSLENIKFTIKKMYLKNKFINQSDQYFCVQLNRWILNILTIFFFIKDIRILVNLYNYNFIKY